MKLAVALLDTQSQNGNWITWEILDKLNKTKIVHRQREGALVETAIGMMRSIGTIAIQMRRQEGNKYFEVLFNVGPLKKPQGYEILFSAHFLNENDIVRVNKDALLPNLVADGLTPEQQAAMEALEQQRQLERERLAANGGR